MCDFIKKSITPTISSSRAYIYVLTINKRNNIEEVPFKEKYCRRRYNSLEMTKQYLFTELSKDIKRGQGYNDELWRSRAYYFKSRYFYF